MDNRENANTRSTRSAQVQMVFGSDQVIWTQEEIDRMARLLESPKVSERKLLALFPGRTLSSIKSKLRRERQKYGYSHSITVGGLDPAEEGEDDDWLPLHKRSARRGSRMLRDAILRVYFNQAPA